MLRTRVGYAGGTKANPAYRSMGDHTEAVSIDYDPSVISYEQLLRYFWSAHRCDRNNRSRQYMNAVFYHNAEQKELAEASRAEQAERSGIPITGVETRILPVRKFTYAENYHQKYVLGRYPDVRDFLTRTYPDAKSLADSAVATRLNAYLGSGMDKDWKRFLKELPEYGLPPDIEKQLRKTADQKHQTRH